mgnify:CR=1 FL=1
MDGPAGHLPRRHQPVRGLLVRKGRIFNDNVQRRHTSAGAAKGRSVGRRVWSGGSPGCHAVPGQSALADSCMPQQQLSVPLPCVHGLLHTFARLVCIWAALAPQCSFCCLCCTMLCNQSGQRCSHECLISSVPGSHAEFCVIPKRAL